MRTGVYAESALMFSPLPPSSFRRPTSVFGSPATTPAISSLGYLSPISVASLEYVTVPSFDQSFTRTTWPPSTWLKRWSSSARRVASTGPSKSERSNRSARSIDVVWARSSTSRSERDSAACRANHRIPAPARSSAIAL